MKHFRSKIDFIPVLLLVLAIFLLDTAAMGVAVPAMANVDNLAPFALFFVATFVTTFVCCKRILFVLFFKKMLISSIKKFSYFVLFHFRPQGV